MRTAIGFGLVLVLAAPNFVSSSDDTLRFYLAKSDLVVLGEIRSEVTRSSEEVGAVYYACEFRIADVLKGRKQADESIHIIVTRFELDEGDRLPELKKGCKCILFLKNTGSGEKPRLETSDVWFGFQRPSPSMARLLKKLAAEEKSKQ
jgi:hypothetical protein